ncbi:class I SAM-dependent RNA methyltransferase [Aquamicrobium sp. LC103]|uniref:class I SAM-dependent RNA methyltransferase n=1 Tax=Aquamicrobium sp. LC103 TaxID=1120658 RepID=UPI00063EBB1E|nr:class I SAM-dependent RNA methyltransferase [Aquamicrobium sp. LC103]TKT81139.1 class I SAM-dependent RNA methyltransferase [Aquamicrobium sp. LC103]
MSGALEISRLGAQGDGIADTPKGQVFVPFTLPGEKVTASVHKDRADLIAVLEASPERVEPPCRHFGICGGCALQHMEDGAYRAWKRSKVMQTLASKHIEADVGELVPCAPETRRRVVFTARRTERAMLLGYNQAFSHNIVAIEECPITLPAIVDRLDDLREVAAAICTTAKPFRMTVTHTASGLDIAAEESGRLEDAERRRAVDLAIARGLARLSIDGEIIVEPKKPVVMMGDVAVSPPPGGFLQAVEAAEAAMAEIAAAHVAKSKKVVDLFSGSGAFALRLARRSEVHAVEGDAAALASLERGFRFGEGLKRVTTERRDLFRRPLTFKELNLYDGLVFDPPRAGAEEQSKQIARSDIPKVAAVSCNPVTLARDLRILIDGGYQLKSVTPLDQFLWSPHVEAVALLEKPRKRR